MSDHPTHSAPVIPGQDQALPSSPVEILGINGAAKSGDDFLVMKSEKEAKELAEARTLQNMFMPFIEDIDVINDEAIMKNNKSVGYVTSGGYAHYVEKSIAFGYLPVELTKKNTKLEIEPLKIETIKFLNWFSEYNLIPKGMSLKLHLLSSEAVEEISDKEYENYKSLKKIHDFKLSKEQEKSLTELKIKKKIITIFQRDLNVQRNKSL